MTTERRNTQRQRTLLGGRIVFNQRRSTLDVVVRNFSDSGALVVLSDSVTLPEAFDLEIGHKQRSYVVRVRWRGPQRLGVVFEGQSVAEAETGPIELARRLKLSEQHNEQLKARITQLTEAG